MGWEGVPKKTILRANLHWTAGLCHNVLPLIAGTAHPTGVPSNVEAPIVPDQPESFNRRQRNIFKIVCLDGAFRSASHSQRVLTLTPNSAANILHVFLCFIRSALIACPKEIGEFGDKMATPMGLLLGGAPRAGFVKGS